MQTHLTIADDETGEYVPAETRIKESLNRELVPLNLVGKVTRERIRYAVAELAGMNIGNVHRWLGEVAQSNPARAIELYIELVSFSLPKLKAQAVIVNDPGNAGAAALSLRDLAAQISAEGSE
jgi:hypothetical protein